MIAAGAVDGAPEAVERNVAVRMARQPTPPSPRSCPSCGPCSTRQPCTGASAGSGLMRLLEEPGAPAGDQLPAERRRPGAALRGRGAPGHGRPFVILAFPERADPDVVYLEDLTSALYVKNVDEVDRYNMFFITCAPPRCPSRTRPG